MTDEVRRQIGVTIKGSARIEELVQNRRWLAEAQDAARFALAVAVSEGVPSGQAQNVETRWAVDGFDPTGEIRAVLEAAYPESTTPVRLIEHLIDEGLRIIDERMSGLGETPPMLLGGQSESVPPE